ncbi:MULTISPECIES: DHH family phosphoesterase [Mycoplasma]|uniref:Phosphoesterase DHH family protein n=2 Tax=Mycoplasma yeatsii TaxID=51365 RepID=S6G927_9MOLU|nr:MULTISPECIES: bifunctional oligoribonuclease/PAP phosphatase NrnA [Mycoplasma]AJM71781.1 DHH family phosphoesterase [Mycoplasma yeatsii GM274B]EOA07490.1 Phosphoesterase DHH family protein [Mycoplasma yeatsii 13926]KNG79596.1 DHH family phosphoesterase [Mycoplasma sp. HU2014]MDQ0567794.1 phosphoesterase RecJ-like protein [Mycoplasma yeatsii]
MDKIAVKKILDLIKENDSIILLRHVTADGDAYGFQFGLRNLIKLNWPEKTVKITGNPTKYLDFIGSDFDEVSDEEFKNSLVIIGDTANRPRIDEPRWHLGKTIVKIDHHPNRDVYGDVMWVDPDYCATSEMLADIIYQNPELKIDADTARIIYHGIVTDSNRFMLRYPKPRTFRLAGFLLEQGFDLSELYQTMYQKTETDLKLTSYVYSNYKTTKNGVSYLYLKYSQLKELGLDTDYVAYEYVNLLSNIKDRPIWAFFCEYENGLIRVELRSQNIQINQVAEKHGGGGHKTAAGIKISSFDIADQVVQDLDAILEKEDK